jgi:hypothetical protein
VRRVVVRYEVKPERVAEHEALLQGVFDELREVAPAGLSYDVVRLADGVSFLHMASIAAADNPLTSLGAFRRFAAEIGSRCQAPPVTSEVALIGTYGVERRADTLA